MGSSDQFGISVATDETGATLVVGAGLESSNAAGWLARVKPILGHLVLA